MSWTFGDGTTSDLQNPSHDYAAPGIYPVTLTVTYNGIVTDSITKTDYIHVVSAEGFPIPLSPGWNFVSTPKTLETGANTAAIFGGVNTEGHSIWLYDASTRRWTAMTATAKVKPLDGIWIYSASVTQVPLSFTHNPIQTPPTKMLYQGWNAIGFSDTVPASARGTLLSVRNLWTHLIGFDAENQLYEVSVINGEIGIHSDAQLMMPAKGYWLYMAGDSELSSISS